MGEHLTFFRPRHMNLSLPVCADLTPNTRHELTKLPKVQEASEKDTNEAVAAAKAAQPAWASLSAEQRGVYFKKLAALLREHNDELATLEAMSMGHPKSGFFHAMACASLFDHYSEAGYNMTGETSLNTPGFINMTLREPYGVAAAIIPWNVPLLMLAKKLCPALTVGNTVVLKSSEKAPLTVCVPSLHLFCV